MALRRVADRWPLWLGPFVITVVLNMGTAFIGFHFVNAAQDRDRANDAKIAAAADLKLCTTRNDDRDAVELTLREAGVDEAVIAIYRANLGELNCDDVGNL